ncbi:MAG: hypothetical protein ACOC5T_10280 [Elusimicrobiota bacterium]
MEELNLCKIYKLQTLKKNMDSISQNNQQNLIPSGDLNREVNSLSSIAKLLDSISDYPNRIRRELRGEMLYENENGDTSWVQTSKPAFVKIDYKTNKPYKIKQSMPWKNDKGEPEKKEIYVVNDEAIEEVISMIKFAGINQINPVGFNTEDNYLEDLKEFECKLAAVLALKQKEWGLDKELLPMIQFKLKTIVQDVRSLSVKGKLLNAIQTTVSRVEQFVESDQTRKKGNFLNPY